MKKSLFFRTYLAGQVVMPLSAFPEMAIGWNPESFVREQEMMKNVNPRMAISLLARNYGIR